MRRLLLPAGWLVAIYVVTVLFDNITPPPEDFWQRVWFETYHVLAHGFVYAVQAGLIAGAVYLAAADIRPRTRAFLVILSLILLLGFGQEFLQSSLRREVTVLGSAWDLLVDVGGASVGLAAYARSGVLRVMASFPARRQFNLQEPMH